MRDNGDENAVDVVVVDHRLDELRVRWSSAIGVMSRNGEEVSTSPEMLIAFSFSTVREPAAPG